MSDSTDEVFTKIVVDLPEAEDGISGEGLWTVKVGQDLYEVRNSPWHTLEINFHDLVKAIEPDETKHPVFVEVVHRGGHRTNHVVFFEDGLRWKTEVLQHLNGLGATYEGRDGSFFAIDLAPEVDFDMVADYLLECGEKDWLDVRYASQPQARGSGDVLN